ncbi:hypothetical protein FQN49_006551, partial [Arthroderma sp. PD_2]
MARRNRPSKRVEKAAEGGNKQAGAEEKKPASIFSTLPPEIHLGILEHLDYRDVQQLRCTS